MEIGASGIGLDRIVHSPVSRYIYYTLNKHAIVHDIPDIRENESV